jgi:hypothetical protein
MTEVTNSSSTTLREYASILDSTQKGMAIFLRQVADEIDLKNEITCKLFDDYYANEYMPGNKDDFIKLESLVGWDEYD